jgi:hypothetical protein
MRGSLAGAKGQGKHRLLRAWPRWRVAAQLKPRVRRPFEANHAEPE